MTGSAASCNAAKRWSQTGRRWRRSSSRRAVATLIATKLFRWEKEEKTARLAKLWVLVVRAAILCLGAYQAWSQHDLVKARILARDLRRADVADSERAYLPSATAR
jgi:hypothetical protein